MSSAPTPAPLPVGKQIMEAVEREMKFRAISRADLARKLRCSRASVTIAFRDGPKTFEYATKLCAAVGLHLRVTCEREPSVETANQVAALEAKLAEISKRAAKFEENWFRFRQELGEP